MIEFVCLFLTKSSCGFPDWSVFSAHPLYIPQLKLYDLLCPVRLSLLSHPGINPALDKADKSLLPFLPWLLYML